MNTFESKSKQSRDTINWNLQIICWFFAVRKTEEIRSFWLYCRKTLSLTEQNFYFVQLINLSFRGQITDRFGLLRRIYDVLHYCAVFLFRIYRYVSLASRISYRLISTIYDSRMAEYAAVNPTQLSQIWSSPMHDFCIFKLVCQKSRLDICVYGIWISGSSISAISTTALYDFCHTTGCCPKIYIKMFQLCTAPW